MSYFVYMLRCADDTFYIGSTDNIEKRLHAHNHLKSWAHYTKIRRPVTLVYHEWCETLSDARKREYILKQLSRVEKMNLITSK
jgi:putative endonuclease